MITCIKILHRYESFDIRIVPHGVSVTFLKVTSCSHANNVITPVVCVACSNTCGINNMWELVVCEIDGHLITAPSRFLAIDHLYESGLRYCKNGGVVSWHGGFTGV